MLTGAAQAMLAAVQSSPGSGAALHSLRAEVTDLRKFAVLNYIAVIKAVKKRNRHLGAKVGAAILQPLRALDLLSQQLFYTSPKLAQLYTQAEILSQVRALAPTATLLPGARTCGEQLFLCRVDLLLPTRERCPWSGKCLEDSEGLPLAKGLVVRWSFAAHDHR